MKLLVLGGTRFVGYHMVEAAVARGHEVTIFHRGLTGTVVPGVEELKGDRFGDLAALAGRRWDAVLDTSAFVPRAVRASASLLSDAVGHYAFVSTISVYAPPDRPGFDEAAPLRETPVDPQATSYDATTYGPLKVLAEREVERLVPGRSLVIRPGIVAGPRDDTDRFTYWAARVARDGRVIVPGAPDRLVQLIDARDLAAWTIGALEGRLGGTYHLVGRATPMSDLIADCRAASASDVEPVWMDPAFIEAQGVEVKATFPLYAPPEGRHLFALDPARAIATGLCHRSLAETAADTLAWLRATRPDGALKAGPTTAEEAKLLAAWDALGG